MAFFGLCSQRILKFSKVSCRQTWLGPHACANRRTFATEHQGIPVTNDDLKMTNLTTSPKTKQDMSNIVRLFQDDQKRISLNGINLLRENIVNDEMYDIASYFLKKKSSFSWMTGFILMGKALNSHLSRGENLTRDQDKVITLIQLAMMGCLMHDDVGDNGLIRFGLPAAHLLWNPNKVIAAGNMIFAINVSESAKLGVDANVNMCLVQERMSRGQVMENALSELPSEGRLENSISTSEYKAGVMLLYWSKSLAQLSKASDLLSENMAKLGFNNSMCIQMIDDIKDIEVDMKDGLATSAVIFASKEHPLLEEMIERKFQQDGDVEKAMELVKNSKGIEQARNLAGNYFKQAMTYLNVLADSPYKAALGTIMRMQYEGVRSSG